MLLRGTVVIRTYGTLKHLYFYQQYLVIFTVALRNSMHWGVAFLTARSGAYAMMMGSLPRDEERRSPEYVDKANAQTV